MENIQPTLRDCVSQVIHRYLTDMGEHYPNQLFKTVLAEVERPMLETVMRHAGGNQCKASIILGISRSNLRSKLKKYDL